MKQLHEEPADFGTLEYREPTPVILQEDKRIPPIVRLALESAETVHPVVHHWVETVVPNLLLTLGLKNAKGMSEAKAREFVRSDLKEDVRTKAISKLTALPDQSLAVHTINAALGAWTLVELAEIDEEACRLYLAGVTMHDMNKMVGEDLRLQGDQAFTYESALKEWAGKLGLWEFVEVRYWPDIAFLAQNAEAKRGENRTLANYRGLQCDPADLEDVAEFVRLADLLASAARHPDDVLAMTGDNKVSDIVRRVLHGKYALRYHRTADNRGLITQVIHNAMLDQARAVGWIPFLFFPDGVTYLAPINAAEPDIKALPPMVREGLISTVIDNLGQSVKRGNFGMKYSAEFVELLDPSAAGDILIERTMASISDKKSPVTDERKSKTTLKPGCAVDLDLDYPPSLHADRFAEGVSALAKLLEDYYGGTNKDTYGEELIRALGMDTHLEAWRSIALTGGVGYPWYYVGGHYAKAHPGYSTEQLALQIQQAYAQVIMKLGEPTRLPPFGFLEAYIPQILSLGSSRSAWDFAGELERYEKNKAPRSGKRVCAVCNSPFESREDWSTFTNKKTVSFKVESGRGICVVCQAEDLLRRFSLGKSMLDPDTTRYLHFYPTYFFTPVTGRAMQRAYENMRNVVFPEVIKPLQEADYDVSTLVGSDIFQVLEPPNPKRRVDRVNYPSHQMHGYYLLGLPYLGRDASETQSWVMPALLGLLSPILFGVKVVVSTSSIPHYASGADFPETTILDGPHSYWQHAMGKTRFRLDEIDISLKATIALYGLTSDAYRDSSGFPIWNQLGSVARALDSDLLSVFSYADRISQMAAKGKSTVTTTDGLSPMLVKRLTAYYEFLTSYHQQLGLGGENRMGMIEGLVDRYAVFYRPRGRAAYARLRPLKLAADVVVRSPHELDPESLQLQIEGRILAMLDGVRDKSVEGWIPTGAWRDEERMPLVEEFARYFLNEVFSNYCKGERSLLRERLNRLMNGCEAYYVKAYELNRQANAISKESEEDA